MTFYQQFCMLPPITGRWSDIMSIYFNGILHNEGWAGANDIVFEKVNVAERLPF